MSISELKRPVGLHARRNRHHPGRRLQSQKGTRAVRPPKKKTWEKTTNETCFEAMATMDKWRMLDIFKGWLLEKRSFCKKWEINVEKMAVELSY